MIWRASRFREGIAPNRTNILPAGTGESPMRSQTSASDSAKASGLWCESGFFSRMAQLAAHPGTSCAAIGPRYTFAAIIRRRRDDHINGFRHRRVAARQAASAAKTWSRPRTSAAYPTEAAQGDSLQSSEHSLPRAASGLPASTGRNSQAWPRTCAASDWRNNCASPHSG